jgi:FAD/FMN-containing dehydrogenase
VLALSDRRQALPKVQQHMLAYGNGRSYGDVCLNENAVLLKTRRLNHFIAFDPVAGRIVCESGLLLKEMLDIIVPRGWFLPVTPGTQFVTVGGAIANDVHGKNQHHAGNFCHHVKQLELVRSTDDRIVCGPDLNPEWFRATVGGLGLTGLITWAEIQLMPVQSPFLWVETRRFPDLESFWELNVHTGPCWPYTVAWIDCLAKKRSQGRGVFFAGKHAEYSGNRAARHERTVTFPIDPGMSLVNSASIKTFNMLYYHRSFPHHSVLTHYQPFFYPLDTILEWNRIYGQRGFFQYQCVLPTETMREGAKDLLTRIAASGQGSFLAVFKTFGDLPGTGMLSFPRPGATLALDFSNNGDRTLALFRELDAVVRNAKGTLYPAKDARMPSDMFRTGFPDWEQFSKFIDPRFSSSFWRRVTKE